LDGSSRPATPKDVAAVDGIFDMDMSPGASEAAGPADGRDSMIRDVLQSGIESAADHEENVLVASHRAHTA
jgi:hypothetical protein